LLDEHKQAIRQALADNRLAISNVNAFMMHAVNDPRQKYWHPSWIEPDRHYRQVRIDHTKRALTLAKELGAPCITTEPGGPVEPGQSWPAALRSEEHTSELQSRGHLVCRLLLEKKKPAS